MVWRAGARPGSEGGWKGPIVDRTTSRRDVARLLALSAVALPAALRSGVADASVRWCKVDPGLLVGDRQAHLNVYSLRAMYAAATGPIEVIVHVPSGYNGQVQLERPDDTGFGHSYSLKEVRQSPTLESASDGIEIVVEAYAPANDGKLPVKVEVIPGDPNGAATRKGGASSGASSNAKRSAKGKANEWISVDNITL
jgi:hypothetical protein